MKKVLFTILCVAGFSFVSSAQFKMSLGPVVGMNYNFYHGSAISNSNMSYNGIGVSIGGQADMSFTPVIGMLISLTAYDMLSASGSITQQGTKSVQDISLGYLMVSPALKFMVPNTGLGFFVGPGIGFKLTGKSEQYQISGGQRTQTAASSDLLNVNPRVAGQIGMSYDFDLKGIYLSPYFIYDHGFTDVTEGGEWKASGVKVGLTCKFSVVK